MKNIFTLLGLLAIISIYAQELDCKITINTQQINQTNVRIFKVLEKNLQEFVNQTQWTSIKSLPNEKIHCSMIFSITSYANNQFTADLDIQSVRPVFGSAYVSTILNHREKNIRFSYLENEPIFFNPNVFTSNLTSIIAYYSYLIIGLDADTFSFLGGNPYFREAQTIVANAQNSGDDKWLQNQENNRWRMITDLMNDNNTYRDFLYQYHRYGLDQLAENIDAKEQISKMILNLKNLKNNRQNSILLHLFVNAKKQEITDLFSSGKSVSNASELQKMLEDLGLFRF